MILLTGTDRLNLQDQQQAVKYTQHTTSLSSVHGLISALRQRHLPWKDT